MTFKKSIEQFLNTVGEEVRVETEGKSYNVKALIEPMRYKNKLYLSGVPTELGYDGLNKYLLICPTDIDLGNIDGINYRLCFGDNAYGVDHFETVYSQNKPAYIWAIVHKEG